MPRGAVALPSACWCTLLAVLLGSIALAQGDSPTEDGEFRYRSACGPIACFIALRMEKGVRNLFIDLTFLRPEAARHFASQGPSALVLRPDPVSVA